MELDPPVMFLSRKAAEALPGRPGVAIISITDPGKRLADLPGYSPGQVLRLSFDDGGPQGESTPTSLRASR